MSKFLVTLPDGTKIVGLIGDYSIGETQFFTESAYEEAMKHPTSWVLDYYKGAVELPRGDAIKRFCAPECVPYAILLWQNCDATSGDPVLLLLSKTAYLLWKNCVSSDILEEDDDNQVVLWLDGKIGEDVLTEWEPSGEPALREDCIAEIDLRC